MAVIRGRFAPSPTGEMHLGNAWTALLAWLHTRQQGGAMILRMEDLDPDRSRPEHARQLMEDLAWLGLDWDEGPDMGGPYGPYRQSERRTLYEEAVHVLDKAGLVYPCYCTRAELQAVALAPHHDSREGVYPGTCRPGAGIRLGREGSRPPALRLMVPAETICYDDGLAGCQCQQLDRDCGDFVVRRSDGVHAYQLAVVVDDGRMAVTHVLRGNDLLSSTPRQLLLYRLLQLPPPSFVHVPLLYGADGHRLSKRHGSLSLGALRRRGVQADAIVGYLAWKAGQQSAPEPVTPADLVSAFSLPAVPRETIVVDGDFSW